MAARAKPLSSLRGAGRMAAWRAHAYGSRERPGRTAAGGRARAAAARARRRAGACRHRLHQPARRGYGSRLLNVLRGLEGAEGVEFPLVGGRDFVGTVARCGPAARVREGQRVWGVVPPHRPGSHADYVLVRDRWVGEAPEALDDASAGGALYAALTASAALRVAGLRGGARGARVLLLGLGGVGHAALQLLVADGARVTVGCAGEQGAHALALGAAAALDRHAPDYDAQLEDGGPYDVILDCAGLGGAEAGARRWQFARYVTLTTPLLRETDERGVVAGTAVATATLLAHSAAAARVSRAASTGVCPPHVRWAYFTPSEDEIEALRKLAEKGKFAVQVERVFPWWEARAALQRAAAGSARGKLLLDFTAQPHD
ncbi:hypothetical protein ABMA27_004662 [Loxostege sticticalis]|uniref:Enoyl reductase (ER) domain-containing protein n=1 Tax=Loxostege sticticalis TaxID=481309 RepID=A0ABR3HPE5_LOXSC